MNCCGSGSHEPKQNNNASLAENKTGEPNASSSNKTWIWVLILALVGIIVYLLF
ncbi:MAG: hypothetical protein US50_C0056G0007 [Candidatus Nomurabacteria bacterium GW2011_GWB1_37_5]|uniref:Uncharacterized protein n=1 Tax=Candidatus Nomurabacteria bacterium GW2011_GWB1_37_5 TaxID=1618742 RepID=A0A0G0JBS5_9BACT|nr:MAG: hypothetical protein US50_C0056G0007 [Candidatus Nomurabacteria bacterium GW2011_GWB1_37_5]